MSQEKKGKTEQAEAAAQPESAGPSTLEQENAELKQLVADQAKVIAAQEATKGDDTPLAIHKSGTYQVLCNVATPAGKFSADGKLTKKQVAENPAAVDYLVGIGWPGMKKVG